MQLQIVDVFAERALEGNQLAVVYDAGGLDDSRMLAIAREMNFSETSFVLERAADHARVRIFTPARELPFAGHPTLGTAWALTGGKGEITLDLPAGAVPVAFADGVGWLVPPQVNFIATLDASAVAQQLGVAVTALSRDWPLEVIDVGPRFAIVAVDSLQALQSLKPATLPSGNSDAEDLAVFVFCEEAYPGPADYAARVFFDAGGVREDPATGSANAGFAAYLRKHRGHLGQVIVDQGVQMLRPSRLYLQVDEVLKVGGKTQAVARGELV